jgi:hypothetical protein
MRRTRRRARRWTNRRSAAAERLIAFDAFREDRQRIALRIFAR